MDSGSESKAYSGAVVSSSMQAPVPIEALGLLNEEGNKPHPEIAGGPSFESHNSSLRSHNFFVGLFGDGESSDGSEGGDFKTENKAQNEGFGDLGQWGILELVAASIQPHRMWCFLALGLPGGVMSALEAACFEITTAMAGVLGKSCSLRPLLINYFMFAALLQDILLLLSPSML